MAKILEILGILVGIIPVVLTLIKEFETPGFGAEKKKAVLDAIGLFYDKLGITVIAKDKLLALVGGFIDIAIAFYNIVGWFKLGNPTVNS